MDVKKARKLALLLLGIPAIAVAILWIDCYYRAVAAIRAEDERLARDIAAFRDRLKPGLPVDASFLKGSVSCPQSFFVNPPATKLEEGHTGQHAYYWALVTDSFGITFPPDVPPPEAVPPGAPQLSVLALTHRAVRECGFDSRSCGYTFEQAALKNLQQAILGLSAPDLRRIAEQLDRARESRSSFSDALEAEHLLDRAEVLRVLHLKADGRCFIRRPPGWREFFSWRVLIAKILNQLRDDYRFHLKTETSPLVEWERRNKRRPRL